MNISKIKVGNKTYDLKDAGIHGTNSVTASGAIQLNGSIPLHVVTLNGNVSSVSLSTNPAEEYNCHVVFTASSQYTVAISHDSTNRICPDGADPSPFTVPAGGYVELDFLTIGGKVYLRGI